MSGARAETVLLGLFRVAQVLALVFRRDCLTADPIRPERRQELVPDVLPGIGAVVVKLLRRESTATIGVLVVTLALYAVLRGDDGAGATQRVSATAVHAWIALVALRLERVGGLPTVAATRPRRRVVQKKSRTFHS